MRCLLVGRTSQHILIPRLLKAAVPWHLLQQSMVSAQGTRGISRWRRCNPNGLGSFLIGKTPSAYHIGAHAGPMLP